MNVFDYHEIPWSEIKSYPTRDQDIDPVLSPKVSSKGGSIEQMNGGKDSPIYHWFVSRSNI